MFEDYNQIRRQNLGISDNYSTHPQAFVLVFSPIPTLGYPDEEQLIWAPVQGRVIYSFNIGDFCRLHGDFIAQERSHADIVLAPQQQYSVGQQLRGLLKLAADKSALEMANQLVFLPFLD